MTDEEKQYDLNALVKQESNMLDLITKQYLHDQKKKLIVEIVDMFANELKVEFKAAWEDKYVKDKQEWVKVRLLESIIGTSNSGYLMSFDKFIERIYKHVYHCLLSKIPQSPLLKCISEIARSPCGYDLELERRQDQEYQECHHPDCGQGERFGS